MRLLLLAALAAECALSLLLCLRQLRAVRRHRDAVPAAFADTVDLSAHRKAADYTAARLRLGLSRTLVELLVAAGWLWGGLAALHAGAAALLPAGMGRPLAVALGFGAVGMLVSLPFGIARTFGVERCFGFNRTTPARYVADLLKGGVLSLALAVPLLLGVFWLMAHARGLWWLYAWAGFTLVSLALSQAVPRWVMPLFNRFTPLEQPLRGRLEELLARCGVRAQGLWVMDASRRSAHGNAFVTGWGGGRRIVLFDTLLARHEPDEIEAVLAHELGHVRHGHILSGMGRGAVLSLAGFAALGLLGGGTRLTAPLGLPADPALTLIAFSLWLGALGPVLGLAGHWFSRRAEFQADRFARDAVGAEPLVRALVRLTRDSAGTLTPDPWFALFEYSHPPVPLRVAELRRPS